MLDIAESVLTLTGLDHVRIKMLRPRSNWKLSRAGLLVSKMTLLACSALVAEIGLIGLLFMSVTENTEIER